ncbi:MAG: Aa3-type terminal oxidase [Candidatus Aramenus sp.]|jgi:thiosulfate dehydrogenase [quinone] small subunit|nr:Aa3-type terminal oxidase [Candidatus Aramenus sp.]
MGVDKIGVIAVLAMLLATGVTFGLYQLNFQGFTHLTNYSKTPAYVLTGTRLYQNGTLFLQIARVAGPDTYGGFVTLVQVLYPNGTVLYQWGPSQLSHIPSYDIRNEFPLHPVHPDKFALVVPLGQNATVILQMPFHVHSGKYIVRVYDVDGQYEAYGIKFQAEVEVS